MNVSAWLASRKPAAPDELQAHMAGLLTGGSLGSDDLEAELTAACNAAFNRVLDSGAASRDSAFDLLSADAFVTYAFEAAADAPETIGERAATAMRQISNLAVARIATEKR